MSLKLVRIDSADHPMFETAMKLYVESFPYSERREVASQKNIMGNSDYFFNLIYDGDTFVGIITFWESDEYIYVEHFAIEPQFRSCGYGSKTLKLIDDIATNNIILEIEPVTDSLTGRRKTFYERAGYTENPHNHIQPPYHKGESGVKLLIMTKPGIISKELYDKYYDYMKNTVMKDTF